MSIRSSSELADSPLRSLRAGVGVGVFWCAGIIKPTGSRSTVSNSNPNTQNYIRKHPTKQSLWSFSTHTAKLTTVTGLVWSVTAVGGVWEDENVTLKLISNPLDLTLCFMFLMAKQKIIWCHTGTD